MPDPATTLGSLQSWLPNKKQKGRQIDGLLILKLGT
jgi:hypothetical protein